MEQKKLLLNFSLFFAKKMVCCCTHIHVRTPCRALSIEHSEYYSIEKIVVVIIGVWVVTFAVNVESSIDTGRCLVCIPLVPYCYCFILHNLTLLANRLVKHTGYGNAAGLLLAHGLLAGGAEAGQDNYSDSDTSDTEEYEESKKQYVHVTRPQCDRCAICRFTMQY